MEKMLVALAVIGAMQHVAVGQATQAAMTGDDVVLPAKTFAVLPDGSLTISGHWKLKEWEDPVDPSGHFPIAAQPMNSTTIRCWPSKRTCEEYRASITKGVLLPLEPLRYDIVSWTDEKIVSILKFSADAEMTFHIDAHRKSIEMEYRRRPSPGLSRIFERWVLE
jgi:hypothetical protein